MDDHACVYQRHATPSRERLLGPQALFAERGYEATSTATICRLAGTSESQLIKHFAQQGILEAIFECAWKQSIPLSVWPPRVCLRRARSSRSRWTWFSISCQGCAASTLFLLEASIHGDGKLVILVPGFLEFVKTVDAILQELACGELAPEIHPQALRSALMDH